MPGDAFLLKRTSQQDDFYHLMNGKFRGEVWDTISRYVYTALQGGSIMQGWTNDNANLLSVVLLTLLSGKFKELDLATIFKL